jgi:hypothetical protein
MTRHDTTNDTRQHCTRTTRTRGGGKDILGLLVVEEDESAGVVGEDALVQLEQDLVPLRRGQSQRQPCTHARR